MGRGAEGEHALIGQMSEGLGRLWQEKGEVTDDTAEGRRVQERWERGIWSWDA